MNKIIKLFIGVGLGVNFLCLSEAFIQGMFSEKSETVGSSSTKLSVFFNLLDKYKKSINDKNLFTILDKWEYLSDVEKIEGYDYAQSIGINLEDFGLEKPRVSKKIKVKKEQSFVKSGNEYKRDIKKFLESNPDLRYASDIAGQEYSLTLREKEKLENELAELKVHYAKNLIKEHNYERLIESNADLLTVNYELEREINDLLNENLKLEQEIESLNKRLSEKSSKQDSLNAQRNARLNAFFKSSNMRLKEEIEQLKEYINNLKDE